MHHLDREAMRIGETPALAAARRVDRLDLRRPFDLGETIEVFLAAGIERHAEEFRRAQMRDMQIRRRIGAAHIKSVPGPCRAHHAEIEQEFFGLIEIGRLQPPESDIANFDDGHCAPLLAAGRCPPPYPPPQGGRVFYSSSFPSFPSYPS